MRLYHAAKTKPHGIAECPPNIHYSIVTLQPAYAFGHNALQASAEKFECIELNSLVYHNDRHAT